MGSNPTSSENTQAFAWVFFCNEEIGFDPLTFESEANTDLKASIRLFLQAAYCVLEVHFLEKDVFHLL